VLRVGVVLVSHMGAVFSRLHARRFSDHDKAEARERVGEGTFTDEELHHLHVIFFSVTAGASLMNRKHFKVYIDAQELYCRATKDEQFDPLFRAFTRKSKADGVSWFDFLDYHLAMKFGLPEHLYGQDVDPSPSGPEHAQHSTVTVPVTTSADAVTARRKLLAEVMFAMFDDEGHGILTRDSMGAVIKKSVRWLHDEDEIRDEQVDAHVAQLFKEAKVPRFITFLNRSDFVHAFVVHDKFARHITSIV
jgi:hypothetical protein